MMYYRVESDIEWESVNGYTIITFEKIERGIFLRWPIQRVYFSDPADLHEGQERQNMFAYRDGLSSPFRRFFERIIGNGKIVNNLKTWLKDYNFAGFRGNILCSPIYFRRKSYTLDAFYTGKHPENQAIKRIHSYGFVDEFNLVAGGCRIEKTKISFMKGIKPRNTRFVRTNGLHYTYMHVVEGIVENGELENE